MKGASIGDFDNCIRVDFANKFIGGGTLRRGAVQEEIMFLCSPECLAAMLICECMLPNEAITISGSKRAVAHSGYMTTFKVGAEIPNDEPNYVISAIDAINFNHSEVRVQFTKENIMRELMKALAGFSGFDALDKQIGKRAAICTGHWGCGAFKGNQQLKFMI